MLLQETYVYFIIELFESIFISIAGLVDSAFKTIANNMHSLSTKLLLILIKPYLNPFEILL